MKEQEVILAILSTILAQSCVTLCREWLRMILVSLIVLYINIQLMYIHVHLSCSTR